MKFLHDILTGPTNDNYELARVLFAIVVLAALGLQAFDLVQGNRFDIQDYALAMAGLLGAGAASTGIKDFGSASAKAKGEKRDG